MAALGLLISSFCPVSGLGHLWLPYFAKGHHAARPALAITFLFTASAHWRSLRGDLLRMMPPSFEKPGRWVTAAGAFQVIGAIGLLFPATAPLAAVCLAILLLALFRADAYAARLQLEIGGQPVTEIWSRAAIQTVFLSYLFFSAYE